MKFKIALWILGRLMSRAGKTNSAFKEKLKNRDITMEIKSHDGAARHFIFKEQTVKSVSGPAHHPTLSLNFRNSKIGFNTFTAKDKKKAMMDCIKEKNIDIEGNTSTMIWFQSLAKLI